mmetsp:Transcript_121666/g.389246  ORF Transcript_121666/g.389246 Transcript_121666/m.389246 type:complete len:83 (+) Transcript_121666:114-362(+)
MRAAVAEMSPEQLERVKKALEAATASDEVATGQLDGVVAAMPPGGDDGEERDDEGKLDPLRFPLTMGRSVTTRGSWIHCGSP